MSNKQLINLIDTLRPWLPLGRITSSSVSCRPMAKRWAREPERGVEVTDALMKDVDPLLVTYASILRRKRSQSIITVLYNIIFNQILYIRRLRVTPSRCNFPDIILQKINKFITVSLYRPQLIRRKFKWNTLS